MKISSRALPCALQEIVASEFGGEAQDLELFAHFLDLTSYEPEFARGLIEIAQRETLGR